MIVDSPAAFRAAVAKSVPAVRYPTAARAAFLVTPLGFRLAEESARDNRYMQTTQATSEARAMAEHAELARRLAMTLPTLTFPGDPSAPDAVFPNNVFATTTTKLIVGSMRHEIRRKESRRADIPLFFAEFFALQQERLPADCVAELTGPLIIDRGRSIGFCGLTERCNAKGAAAMDQAFELDLTFTFDLQAGEYHTNVVMSVLASRALVIHAGSFVDPDVPQTIAEIYGERVIWLEDAEKAAFAGNCIALSERDVWMSDRAAASLTPRHRADLEGWGFELRSAPLDEIEKAGGSLRCCVAEIY
ncbi:MAG: arginine deiminase-related protein [Thermoanaerobaculia bacterium]